MCGGVCGGGKVKDSFNCGTITATGKYTMPLRVGGCIGRAINEEIQRCYNTGDVVSLVETTGTNEHSVGGVAGLLYQVHAKDCYSIGNVTAEERC